MTDDVIETLRNCSGGDRLRVTVDDDEGYTLYVVDGPFYEPPDEHYSGELDLGIELDTEVHAVPTKELPTETGDIRGSQSLGHTEISTPTLAIWDPILDNDDPSLIVGDDWILKGEVTDAKVLD